LNRKGRKERNENVNLLTLCGNFVKIFQYYSTHGQFRRSHMLLLVVFGCAKNDVGNVIDTGVIVSDVINIGQVRTKDSPAKTSFTITNAMRFFNS